MRIYNGKNSQVSLPLSNNTRVTIPPHSVSKDIMPSDYFLTMIAQTYDENELALIVAGPYEINMCAKNPACTPMVVQSLDEAVDRFANKSTVKVAEPVKEVEPVKEEVKVVETEKLEIPEVKVEESPEKEEEVVEAEPKEEKVIAEKKLKPKKFKKQQ